ncbi:hypothetical protein RQP46_009184 [Phenoliferia psychrophenolica]
MHPKRARSPSSQSSPVASRQKVRVEEAAVAPFPSSSAFPDLAPPELATLDAQDIKLAPLPMADPAPFPTGDEFPELLTPTIVDEIVADDLVLQEPEPEPAPAPPSSSAVASDAPTSPPTPSPTPPAPHRPLIAAPNPSIAREGRDPATVATVADFWTEGGWFEDEVDEPTYPYDASLNSRVSVWKGDITSIQVDAIVNAANRALLGGGGVDGAIHSAAGGRLYDECKLLDGAETGESKITWGYRLPAKYIIHTVGPVYSRSKKEECERLLRSCYQTTLEVAVANDVKTLAFSGISTGIYGYPLDDATRVALDVTRNFLASPAGASIEHVIFTVFRQIDVDSYLSIVPEFFPPPPTSTQAEAEPKESVAAPEVEAEIPAAAAAAVQSESAPPVVEEAEVVEPTVPATKIIVLEETVTTVPVEAAVVEATTAGWKQCVVA